MKKLVSLSLGVIALVCFMSQPLLAKEVYELVLSSDAVLDHPTNQGILSFIEKLEDKTDGQIKVKFYHSGQLYKDEDIIKALALGSVDMGVPGIWFVDKIDPNAAIVALPMFYAQPPDVTRKLLDGDFGQELSKNLEKKLKVKILGKWLELGMPALHTTDKKIEKLEDLKGLRIRYFGGKINAVRLKALGASPVPIPWPEVAMALTRGTCDGLITSFKPLHSAKLVEAGITYSVKDRQYMMHQVPMVSNKFWSSLPNELQTIMVDVWDENIDYARELAGKMQIEGELEVEALLMEKGGGIFRPDDETLAKWRKKIMYVQDDIVKEMKMDPEIVDKARKMLGM
jgi:C4-dicarboxylate-binding protein DctP